jgi:hypothetical protein
MDTDQYPRVMFNLKQKGSTMQNENDTRYPYTYAADFVRGLAGYGEGGTKLSRSDASQVRQGIADALGMDDAELARKLADYYKANEATLTEKAMRSFLPILEKKLGTA